MRDHADEIIRAISLTPFSREELVKACTSEPGLTKTERARRFFTRARQTRTGLAQTSSEGRWATACSHRAPAWRAPYPGGSGSVEGLPQIVQRLQRVQIENAPATEVIRRYDSPETLFYCDPPDPHEARGDSKAYGFELTNRSTKSLQTAFIPQKGLLRYPAIDVS